MNAIHKSVDYCCPSRSSRSDPWVILWMVGWQCHVRSTPSRRCPSPCRASVPRHSATAPHRKALSPSRSPLRSLAGTASQPRVRPGFSAVHLASGPKHWTGVFGSLVSGALISSSRTSTVMVEASAAPAVTVVPRACRHRQGRLWIPPATLDEAQVVGGVGSLPARKASRLDRSTNSYPWPSDREDFIVNLRSATYLRTAE